MSLSPQFLQALASMKAPSGGPNAGANVSSNALFNVHSDPANVALARALLTSGKAFGQNGPNAAQPSSASPSVISRILDVLSRPLYATADAAYESQDAMANNESFWDQVKGLGTGAVHGLSGTQKRTWNDVLQQGKDINAQNEASGENKGWLQGGRGAGYTQGQGGELSTGDKITGFGLNVVADPLNAAKPIEWARQFGDAKGLYHIPTLGEVSRKAFKRNPVPSEQIPATPEVVSTPPRSTLLDINPQAIAKASSISDVLHAKIGEPVKVEASHPHIHIDPEALANGVLKTTAPHLTDEGKLAAQGLHSTQRQAFNAAAAGEINKLKQSGLDPLKATNEYLKGLPSPKGAAQTVHANALNELRPTVASSLEHNENWIAEAVKNGVDPQRAIQVVKDVQGGDDFKAAFEDAVRGSKVFRGAKVAKVSELGKGAKSLTAETNAMRLSRILAPTPGEVLNAVDPANPSAAKNIKAIQQAKALNAIKRAGAASKGLSADEQAIANDAAQVARHKIMGTGGFSPTGSFNDLAQSSVWNLIRGRVANITKGGASNIRGLNERTLRIAAHVEDALEKEGFNATAADGTPARLTEAVLNNSEFPNKLNSFPNRILNDYVNGSLVGAASKAEQAAKDAATSKPIIQKATLAVNEIFKDPALSDPVKHLLTASTAKQVEDSIVMNTGSTRAGKAGREIFKAMQANLTTAPQGVIQQGAKALVEIVKTGAIPTEYNALLKRLMTRIEETLQTDPHSLSELPIPQGGQTVETHLLDAQAAAEGGFLGLMATWFGQSDLRSAVVRGMNTARTNASTWGKYWHDTFSNLTQPQRIEAARAAQGLFEPVNEDVIKAAGMFKSRMENLFSSSGLSEFARQGNTVATRGGLIRDGKYGINAELKRVGSQFKFTGGSKVKNMFGEERDFSQGTDWLNSWEVHKFGGDVSREMARIETAVYNYMGKKAIFDNIAHYHGAAKATKELNATVKDVPFLKGVYFHPDVAQQIPRVVRDLYISQHAASPMLRNLDNVMRMWKTNVTIYSPSHAIHNGMGDIYNNWIAGVNSPRAYTKALRVMATTREDYPTLERLGLYVNQNPANALNGARATERASFSTADGQKLTASQIKIAAHNQGILQGVQHIEDIANAEGGVGSLKFQPFGGKVNAVAHGWVQGMDHFTRLAQFIHEVERGRGPLHEIFDGAGSTVRKYHPDGMDLTAFERNTLRRIIPFYSWTRKAIPFSIEGMLTKPGKFMVYPKASMELNVGNASNVSPGQQFPSDQLFPSWITDEGIGPWGGPGGFLNKLTGGPEGYVTGSLSVPPIDLLQTYGNHPNEGILSGLSPLIKDPIELMQGRRLDTGIPITDPGQYAAEAIPTVGLMSRLTNVTPLGVTQKGQQQGVGNQAAFTNFLTGLKLTNTGQYIKSAQYELHQKQTEQKKTNRQHLANFLKSVNGG